VVTAVGPGTTILSATSEGKVASRNMTVLAADVPPSSARVVIAPQAGWLALGVPYTLAVTAYDAAGGVVTNAPVALSTSDASIATVSQAGVVQPLRTGTVTISALAADGSKGTATLVVTDKQTVDITVTTLDGAAPQQLRLAARLGAGGASEQRFSADVDAVTGRALLDLPVLPASAGALELYVDAPPGVGRRYHPSWVRLAAGVAPGSGTKVLLVPRDFVADSGTYAGTRVSIDLDKAFTPVCTTAGESNCQSFWPAYFLTGIKMWPDSVRPVPLAIDRTGVGGAIQASDSVRMWVTIRQMEADLGRHLYEPAMFTAYTTTGYTTGMVLVTVDPTVGATQAYTNWSWNGRSDLYQARSRFGAAALLSSSNLVTHELLHAQGFHHTCQWTTVMGGYGCGSVPRLSENDVAYYQMAQLIRRRTRALLPTWGLAEALSGQRVIEMGMTPAAAVALRRSLDRMSAGADSSGHDGAH
jgi:hypothetical protein